MDFINVVTNYKFDGFTSKVASVTDTSSFRPDSEQVRALKFNPQGSGSTPVYDYPDGSIPDDDPVSDEIVALRSGKLDKAEINSLKDKIINDAKRSKDENEISQASKSLKELLGVSENSNQPSEK
uniref:Uncharacterized protein n=1 Tax=Dulem virus 233 TaxID=3145710 RepID=A0AAU8AWP1_9VIRU